MVGVVQGHPIGGAELVPLFSVPAFAALVLLWDRKFPFLCKPARGAECACCLLLTCCLPVCNYFFGKVGGWQLFLAGFAIAENFVYPFMLPSTAFALHLLAYAEVPPELLRLREATRSQDVVACGAQYCGVVASVQTVVVHALPA